MCLPATTLTQYKMTNKRPAIYLTFFCSIFPNEPALVGRALAGFRDVNFRRRADFCTAAFLHKQAGFCFHICFCVFLGLFCCPLGRFLAPLKSYALIIIPWVRSAA